ncbi:MAG: hypothetical protein NZ739_11640 [Verrucomicrobiae bacterium]|nr:hypothetical protein [Verrucomicrobiae bacterium]
MRLFLAYGIGAVAPLLVCCVALWYAGVFEQFVFWTITYASQYASIVSLSQVPGTLFGTLEKFAQRDAPLWAMVVAGAGFVLGDERFAGIRTKLLVFCAAAFLTTVPGFYFRRHYFILALPAAGLLAGCGVSAARAFLARKQVKGGNAMPVWMYVGVTASAMFLNGDIWFRAAPEQASRQIYFGNPFAESQVIAEYIRTNSAPDAKVAILGSEPQIFFLSGRRSATGYIYTYPLMEPHRYAERMQKQMIREIESEAPEFVLFVAIPLSWLAWPGASKEIIDWWANSYRTNYALVGVVAVNPVKGTQYFWDRAAVEFGEHPRWGILIYRRKNS